jgi:hypothetical protein
MGVLMDALIHTLERLKGNQQVTSLTAVDSLSGDLEAILAIKSLSLDVHELAQHILLHQEIDLRLERLKRELLDLSAVEIVALKADHYNPFDLVNELSAHAESHLELLPRQVRFIDGQLRPFEHLFS